MSLNVSDFNSFFMWKLQPPGKSHPLFPSIPSLKFDVLSSPPLSENLVGDSTPWDGISKLKFVGAIAFYVDKYHLKDWKTNLLSYIHNVLVGNAIIKQFLLKVPA